MMLWIGVVFAFRRDGGMDLGYDTYLSLQVVG